MRLSRFIHENMQAILAEWDAFARDNAPPGGDMSDLALRDHAAQILDAIARDIETEQSDAQQLRKSQGLADSGRGSVAAAAVHGVLRLQHEFSLVQLTAEYRALRATVLRLWTPGLREMDPGTAQEIVRFNEAVDQALAESVGAYEARASQTRELFLAVLGHDLRSPLSTVDMIGTLMVRQALTAHQVGEMGARLQRSSALMLRMVGDLLGFARIQLGGGMPINPRPVDLREPLRSAMADACATHPGAHIALDVADGINGCWDPDRLHQLFMNLMINAVQHGTSGRPVTVAARRDGARVVIDVTNHGPPIRGESLRSIFKPLVQHHDGESSSHATASLGLGLYIAREVAGRHGGGIEVASSDVDGTTFRVTLPLAMDRPAASADGTKRPLDPGPSCDP